MIIRTKNSAYEIQGKWIRKVEGKSNELDRHFTAFVEFIFMPEIGKRLMVSFGDRFLRTSIIQSIEEDE